MNRFDKFIDIIFKNEGFISNDKFDKGGLTKYGISQRTYPDLNIKNLTIEQAKEIYYTDFYLPCQIDLIRSELLALHVFDFAVNAGVYRASKILQSVVNTITDGIIGAKTLEAANKMDYSQKYIDKRLDFYIKIGIGDNRKFLKGWINRVNNTTKYITI